MQERVDLPKTKNQNITVKYQNLEEENRALRAKIKRIEQERDILKPQRILQPKICKIRFYRETWYLLPYQASL